MSLIKCPECGKEMSDLAEKCPNCGAPNPNYDPDKPKPGELYTACSKHPDKKSVLKCSACGKEMCSVCGINSKTFEDGDVFCPECYLKFLKKRNHDAKKTITFSYIAIAFQVVMTVVAICALIGCIYKGSTVLGIVTFWFIMGLGSAFSSYKEMMDKEKNSGDLYKTIKMATDKSYENSAATTSTLAALLVGPIVTALGIITKIFIIKGKKALIESSLPEIEEYERIVAERASAE